MFFDTIAAISTPIGEGGISIIRISGEKSFEILDRIFERKNNKNRDLGYSKFNYGYIKKDDKIIDEVMVVRLKAPYTYTKENIVEINCHGGKVVTNSILQLILEKGARLASKGEFTKRAFLNGRIDLTQAEAIIDLIKGNTEKQVGISINQLRGDLKNKILNYKETILELAAHVNVVLDYPEEGIDDPIPEELIKKLKEIYLETENIINTYDKGKKIREGIKTAIIGRPNVGKSTLLNALLREERAIVTEIAGTTRDIIEESINIKGILLNLIDTAGIRETKDVVESIGVAKSREYINKSDLVLMVLDSSKELSEEENEILNELKQKDKKYIIILNKIDLGKKININDKNIIEISAQSNLGIEEMEEFIYKYIVGNDVEDSSTDIVLTNIRHKGSLEKTKESIVNILETLENGYPLDLVSVDIKEALDSLGEITGEITSEDILDKVFSSFCVGK